MDLQSLTVQGFRRFKQRTTLKTNGKLVAILGPNEAGKSSLLQAVRHLSNDEPPAQNELSRGKDAAAFEITGRFFLSKIEKELAGLDKTNWMVVTKTIDGEREYEFLPEAPQRDKSNRVKLVVALRSALGSPTFQKRVIDTKVDMLDRTSEVLKQIESLGEDVSQSLIDLTVEYHLDLKQFFEKAQ